MDGWDITGPGLLATRVVSKPTGEMDENASSFWRGFIFRGWPAPDSLVKDIAGLYADCLPNEPVALTEPVVRFMLRTPASRGRLLAAARSQRVSLNALGQNADEAMLEFNTKLIRALLCYDQFQSRKPK